MKYKLIKSSQHLVSNWGGGTTTQLYIFPENANYEKQDFKFRVSTATVDALESDFTILNNYSRQIMILSGEIKLVHQNNHTIKLKKYDVDKFLGSWNTKSYGKCIDFNLMLQIGVEGTITAKKTGAILLENNKTYTLYILKNNIEVILDNEKLCLNKSDFLIINPCNLGSTLTIQNSKSICAIMCTINK